ncbi:MAG: phage major capsid protein [Oscillospiraceae bacterium]|nr:phage major capsid protein [Oscillospiraceae bacterium]
MKKKLIALVADRRAALDAAEAAKNAGNQEEFKAQMEKAANILNEIHDVQNLLAEQERQIMESAPSAAEMRDMAAERGVQLMNHQSVRITNAEIMRELRNSVTIGGTLVQPTGADSQIHGDGPAISSILDMVQVEDLTGLGGYEVPYLISEFDGTVGNITSKSGQARSNSDDPTFGISVLKPLEVTTTSYVDRNIAKLSPANYYEKVHQMALRALRRKVCGLIVNGDSLDATKTMYGIKNALNKAGSSIIKTDTYSSIDVNTLDELYFAYGANSELGGEAVLQLTKADLKAIGELRGTNEKARLFKITPAGNGNTGIIADGGVQIPYVLVPDLSSGDLIYGNPLHYLLGLFGDYEVRIDESVKAIERMHTILGDVSVGGNVIEHEGFVYFSSTVSAG